MGVSDPPLPNAVQQVSSQPSPDTSSKRTPRKRHKSEGLRLRLSDIQKAKAVEHFLTIPGMKQAELILWCVKEFKLEKNPSTTAVSDWLQPSERKRLFDLLATETNPFMLQAKSHRACRYPDLEFELFSWFKRHEMKGAIITGELIQCKAREIAGKRGFSDFACSEHWLHSFKKRCGTCIRKVMHGEAGSADLTYVHIAKCCSQHNL